MSCNWGMGLIISLKYGYRQIYISKITIFVKLTTMYVAATTNLVKSYFVFVLITFHQTNIKIKKDERQRSKKLCVFMMTSQNDELL